MSIPVAKYTRVGNVHTIDFGIPAMSVVTIDFDKVAPEERDGIAKALLSAATLSCYVGTLGVALEARDANFDSIQAEAIIGLGHNANAQPRVSTIDLNVAVEMPEASKDVFERCQKIMKNGCLVTASVHEGVHMKYNLSGKFKK